MECEHCLFSIPGAMTGFNPGLGWSQIDAQAIYGYTIIGLHYSGHSRRVLADQILGSKKAVTFGAILLALGHLGMAIENSEQILFLGLILNSPSGTGLLKGNISTIVGQLV